MGLFSLGVKNLVSKFKMTTWKKCVVQPPGVLPCKVWFPHSDIELGMYLRRSYFFRSKLGWRKSHILVMNRVRVLGSGLHKPHTIVLAVPPPPFSPRDVHTGIPRMKVILKNNVKGRKSCIPKPHVHAFYISNFRGQISILRTQNGA